MGVHGGFRRVGGLGGFSVEGGGLRGSDLMF